MLGKRLGTAMIIICCVAMVSGSQQITIQPLQPLRAVLLQPPTHYLHGNMEEVRGMAMTEKGEEETQFFGTVEFQVWAEEKGELRMRLSKLNLVSKGVQTAEGESGTLGLRLAETSAVEMQSRSGEFSADVEAVLHYELIDRIRGYKKQECRGECDLFEPYTERMSGKLHGKFAEPLEPREEGKALLEAELVLELRESVLGRIRRITVIIIVVIDWSKFKSADCLRIQPVFIGSGPSDPMASAAVFNTLMNYSHDMWNRCGDVRCIKFVVNSPIYVNNSAYHVLDNSTEAAALRAEVNVANAVEVFVVPEMSISLACSWGGGACFSSGTASAKVVSTNQQMAVPCPCPTACTGYCPCGSCLCGAINPYHLAHELGHALNLPHPTGSSSTSTVTSIMEPSGLCCDNPNLQSAKNCRNATNPLLFSLISYCAGTPDIND